MESELSLLEELTLEKLRISAQIPDHLLIYSKVQFNRKILLFISLIFLILFIYSAFYFQNNYYYLYFICFIYFILIKFFINNTKTKSQQTNIKLPLFNFNY